jgi:hypothetical protein
MRMSEAFPSPFLKAGDLNDKEPVLTITAVETETVGDGEERRCLSFKETGKKFLVNKTNWSRIAELTGAEDDADWAGHQIRLTKKRVNFRGDMVDALRVDAVDRPF